MIGYLLLISGLALLGGAALRWSGHRSGAARPAEPVISPASDARDRLAQNSNGGDECGLAVFYAYQLAAGKINRSR